MELPKGKVKPASFSEQTSGYAPAPSLLGEVTNSSVPLTQTLAAGKRYLEFPLEKSPRAHRSVWTHSADKKHNTRL